MKKRHILFQAVSLGLALLMAGCGAAQSGNSATGETSTGAGPADAGSAETTAAPAYTGPLYELTFENLNERLPELQNIFWGDNEAKLISPYDGMALWYNFAENGTFQIARETKSLPDGRTAVYRKFCDGDFQLLPIEGYRELLCGYNGYRMFLLRDEKDVQGYELEVYDPQNNLIFTTEGKYFYDTTWVNKTPIFLKTGWLPVKELATSRAGFVNVYTQEWHPLESDDYVLYGTGMLELTIGTMSNSFYSDGLAFVADAEPARQYAWNVDRKIEGFIDETGEFAFRFDDLPDFDGLMVTTVTGYLDGSCMVAGRIDDGVKTGYSNDAQIQAVDINFFYRIDTSGNILEEVDYETFEEFQQKVLWELGVADLSRGSYTFFQADSLQVADGLELRVKNPLTEDSVLNAYDAGGYELVDANGTVYSLDDYNVVSVLVGDDGTILLKCNSNYRENWSADFWNLPSSTSVWYRLKYDWIAPDGYVLPEGENRNLSVEGLTLVTDYRNQEQVIQVTLFGVEDINDLTLHFTGEDFTSDYVVKEEDYQYKNSSAVGPYKDLGIQFVTLSDDEITITCDWTDDEGNAHHGTYDSDSWEIVEDAA